MPETYAGPHPDHPDHPDLEYAIGTDSGPKTPIYVDDENCRKMAEGKVSTDPNAIAGWLAGKAGEFVRIGMETGPLAVWLWNELAKRGLAIVCLDARHASAALSMMPNKTDRHDAAGLAPIVRTGWFREVRIKSHGAYVVRALLSARDLLVSIRGKIENEIRGLLKTFGIMFGKRVGGLPGRCADEVAPGHAVQGNRKHHFDPPAPTQTCGDPCDRPRRGP